MPIEQLVTFLVSYLIIFLEIIQYIVIIQVVYSWFSNKYNNRFLFFILMTSTSVYNFIRKFLPTRIGHVDLTPLIAILGIDILK